MLLPAAHPFGFTTHPELPTLHEFRTARADVSCWDMADFAASLLAVVGSWLPDQRPLQEAVQLLCLELVEFPFSVCSCAFTFFVQGDVDHVVGKHSKKLVRVVLG